MSKARVNVNKLNDFVSVKDFGAVGDGVTDDTTAIEAAQQAVKNIYVPPGQYSVSGLRIYNSVNLVGAGYDNTQFLQRVANQPAINCTSDATVGQLLGIRLENFGVVGHASASVAAVKIEALGVYAIFRSHFDMQITNTYQGLNLQAFDANNVYGCTFICYVGGTTITAVVLNGGAYNDYNLFIWSIGNGRAIEHNGFNNTFTRLVTEGQIVCVGQNITYISPRIEQIKNTPPTPFGIFLQGFNQTLILPVVECDATNSARIDYCIQPGFNSLIINPRFLVSSSVATLHPFAGLDGEWTLEGPGQNNSANKMEAIYNGNDALRDLRRVARVGRVDDFSSTASGTYDGKTVQYLAPAAGASINYRIDNATDAMIFDPAGTVTLININLGYANTVRKNGQTLSVYAKEAISSLTWAGNGSDVSNFPASMTAGQVVRFVYRATGAKWFPI